MWPFFPFLPDDFGYPYASTRTIEEAATRHETSVMTNSLEDDGICPARDLLRGLHNTITISTSSCFYISMPGSPFFPISFLVLTSSHASASQVVCLHSSGFRLLLTLRHCFALVALAYARVNSILAFGH